MQLDQLHLHVILICASHGADNNYVFDASILGQVNLCLLSKPVHLQSIASCCWQSLLAKPAVQGVMLRLLHVDMYASLQFLACLLLQSTSQVSVPQLSSVSFLGQHWSHCSASAKAKPAETAHAGALDIFGVCKEGQHGSRIQHAHMTSLSESFITSRSVSG